MHTNLRSMSIRTRPLACVLALAVSLACASATPEAPPASPPDTAQVALGKLRVDAYHNGALGDTDIHVYRAGTRHLAGRARTGTDAESNPAIFELPEGSYDVDFRSVDIAGRPHHIVADVDVIAGIQTQTAHGFTSGELVLGVTRGGRRVDTIVAIYPKADETEIARARSYTETPTNPYRFVLPAGDYRIRVQAVSREVEILREVELTVTGKAELTYEVDLDE